MDENRNMDVVSPGLWLVSCSQLPAFPENDSWLSQAPDGGLVAAAEWCGTPNGRRRNATRDCGLR